MTETNPRAKIAEYWLRNYGPWTVVEYELDRSGTIGHTTALGDGAGSRFQSGEWTDQFLYFLNGAMRYHSAEQIHGETVATADGSSRCHRGVDGLFTTNPEQTMLVRTADCMPVYVWANEKENKDPPRRRALLHAGWRGLVKGIVPRTIQSRFEGAVNVFVGPHIGVENYEVGTDVITSLEDCLGLDRDELETRGLVTARDHADLFQILRAQLGQLDRSITMYRTPMGTCQTEPVPLLSYRRDGTENRILNWYGPRREVD